MFPKGVIYEGVGDEQPTYFRGESGANDSCVYCTIVEECLTHTSQHDPSWR